MPDNNTLQIFGIILAILAVLGLVFLRRLLFHLASYLIGNAAGRIILGSVLCLGGLIYGLTSSFTPYTTLSPGTTGLLVPHVNTPDDGDVYLQDINNLGVYYVIHDADFSPQFDASSLQNGGFTSLTYDTSSSEQIQTSFSFLGPNNGIDTGTGYPVEQFSLNGTTFTSIDFAAHPQGHFQNHWLIGGGLFAAGLLILLIIYGLPYLNKRWEREAAVPVQTPVYQRSTAPLMQPAMPQMPPTPPNIPPAPHSHQG